jgi:hypothetical protein
MYNLYIRYQTNSSKAQAMKERINSFPKFCYAQIINTNPAGIVLKDTPEGAYTLYKQYEEENSLRF